MRKSIPSNPHQDSVNAVLRQQIHTLHTLQNDLKSIPLGTISMAQCVQHSKRLAKISAKIEAYSEVIELLDGIRNPQAQAEV